MTSSGPTVRLLSTFDEVAVEWDALLVEGSHETVFATPGYVRSWWDAFGRGELLTVLVCDQGRPAALAFLFVEEGVAYPVGSGGSDYLDVVGRKDDPGVWIALLEALFTQRPDLRGVRWYHVPNWSPTTSQLPKAAETLGLSVQDEGGYVAPALDLADPSVVAATLAKKSLRRKEQWFRREGDLDVTHAGRIADIAPYLDAFFDQHTARWAHTEWPSLFTDERQRDFYRRLAEAGSREGWVRFTRVRWNGTDVAHHFGFHFRGNFLWYKPSFDVSLARHSPGEVLLRHLISSAAAENADLFDFGLGDEAFKSRFATHTRSVTTWGTYR